MSNRHPNDFPVDPYVVNGGVLAERLTRLVESLDSLESGYARPSYATRGTIWLDESNIIGTPSTVKMMIFDGVHDVFMHEINVDTGEIIGGGGGTVDPTLFYRRDGSQPITAAFQADGNQLKGVADGVDPDDAATYGQMTGELGNYYNKGEFIGASAGAEDSGKPVILGLDGKLDPSMGGSADPPVHPELFYKLDGTQPLTEHFASGGFRLLDVADGTADDNAATVKQVNEVTRDDLYYRETEFIDLSSGAGSAGKPIVLGLDGKVSPSMLSLTGLVLMGDFTPSAGNEYPDITGADPGSYWAITGLSSEYTFTGGELAGETIDDGNFMLLGANKWVIVKQKVSPDLFYRLDGSAALTAPLAGGGQLLSNIADGVGDKDAVNREQLDLKLDASGTASDSDKLGGVAADRFVVDTDAALMPAGGHYRQHLVKNSSDDWDLDWDDPDMPLGGSAKQVLAKNSNTERDYIWDDPTAPFGGLTGQILAKKSNTDGDTEWIANSGGGGGGGVPAAGTEGQVLTKIDSTDYNTKWSDPVSGREIHVYSNVASLKDASLDAGIMAATIGYYTPGDGGQAQYFIKSSEPVDEHGNHTLDNGNVAILQVNGAVSIKQFGAKGDMTNDAAIGIQAAHDFVGEFMPNSPDIFMPAGSYSIQSTVTVSTPIKLTGEGTRHFGTRVVSDPAFKGTLFYLTEEAIFENFAIIGSSDGGDDTEISVQIEGANNIHMVNIYFLNSITAIEFTGSTPSFYNTIENCRFDTTFHTFIRIDNTSSPGVDLIITNTRFLGEVTHFAWHFKEGLGSIIASDIQMSVTSGVSPLQRLVYFGVPAPLYGGTQMVNCVFEGGDFQLAGTNERPWKEFKASNCLFTGYDKKAFIFSFVSHAAFATCAFSSSHAESITELAGYCDVEGLAFSACTWSGSGAAPCIWGDSTRSVQLAVFGGVWRGVAPFIQLIDVTVAQTNLVVLGTNVGTGSNPIDIPDYTNTQKNIAVKGVEFGPVQTLTLTGNLSEAGTAVVVHGVENCSQKIISATAWFSTGGRAYPITINYVGDDDLTLTGGQLAEGKGYRVVLRYFNEI